MNKDRKSGFYWVRIRSGNSSRWVVCEYDEVTRDFNHLGVCYPEESFLEVDERKIERLSNDKNS